MSVLLENSNTVVVNDSIQADSSRVVQAVADRDAVTLSLLLDDGDRIELPTNLARFVLQTLQGLSRGPVSITSLPESLTSSTAAELLGISRPTLMKWVVDGRICSKKVGSHHRFDVSDVLKLRATIAMKRREAFDRLREIDEEFEDLT